MLILSYISSLPPISGFVLQPINFILPYYYSVCHIFSLTPLPFIFIHLKESTLEAKTNKLFFNMTTEFVICACRKFIVAFFMLKYWRLVTGELIPVIVVSCAVVLVKMTRIWVLEWIFWFDIFIRWFLMIFLL